MNRRGLMGGFIVASSIVSLAIGCWPTEGGTEVLSDALEMERAIGGNDTRIVVTRDDYPDLPSIDYWSLLMDPQAAAQQFEDWGDDFTPTTRLVAVNPVSLEVTPLGDQLPPMVGDSAYAVTSDGRWIVWPDDEADLFQVFDLDTQQSSTLFAGLVSEGMWIDKVENSWVLATVPRGSESIIVAHNLETGNEVSVLANTSMWGAATLSGGQLAVQYYPDLLPQDAGIVVLDHLDLEPLLSSNVDVIDLSTGQRSTVLTDLPADALAQIGGDQIWISDQPEGSGTRVRTYDLATHQTQTLLEIPQPASEDDYTSIDSVGAIGAVLHSSSYQMDTLGSRSLWELITPDGQRKTVLDYQYVYDPFSWSYPLEPWPAIVGKWIVYQDPDSGGWIVYDPAADTRGTVHPFE